MVQAHALAFGAQTARVGIYKLLDILLPPGGESFGILRPDASRRPAFDAYQTTVRYLGGFKMCIRDSSQARRATAGSSSSSRWR